MEHKHEQATTTIQTGTRHVAAWERNGDPFSIRKPKLGPELKGKYVAIDIETGEYEIADELLAACRALYARLPEAQSWGERIGYRAVGSFVGHTPEDTEWSTGL